MVRKVASVRRNIHFSGKVEKTLDKKSFVKITISGLLFAGNRVCDSDVFFNNKERSPDVGINKSY